MPIQACRTTSFREVCRGNPSQRGTKHTKRAPLTVLLGVLAWCRKCEASAPKLYVHSDLSIVERQILARETRLKQFSARETSNDFGISFFFAGVEVLNRPTPTKNMRWQQSKLKRSELWALQRRYTGHARRFFVGCSHLVSLALRVFLSAEITI